MKKLLLIALMGLSVRAYADTKISAFTSTTTLNVVDIIPVVTNPSSSPANRSITKTNLASTLDILTQSSATATYLQNSSATVTYAPISGSSNYIRNTSTLQSGATVYTSSGTINVFNTNSTSTLKYTEIGNLTHSQKIKMFSTDLPISGGFGPQVVYHNIIADGMGSDAGYLAIVASTYTTTNPAVGIDSLAGITISPPGGLSGGNFNMCSSSYTCVEISQTAATVGSPLTFGIDSLTNALVATNASGVLVSTTVNLGASNVGGILPVSNGGTGTATPSITAGTNITSVTGTWPNVTINAATQSGSGGSSAMETMVDGVRLSSPTPTLSLIAGSNITLTPVLAGGTSAQITISASGSGAGDNLGSHISTKTITANYGIATSTLSASTGTFSSATFTTAANLSYVPDSTFSFTFPTIPMKPVLMSSGSLVTPSVMYQLHDPSRGINSVYLHGTPNSTINNAFWIDADDASGTDPSGLNGLGITVTGSQVNSTMIALNTDVHTTGDAYNEWSRATTAGGTVYVNKLEAAGSLTNYAAWLKATGGTSNHAVHLEDGDLSLKNSNPTTGYFMIGQGVSAVPKWTNTIPSSMTITDIYTTYGQNVSTLTVRSLTNALLATDAAGVAISTTVNLGASNVGGTLAAGRFPALTGDVTTSAGSLATTLASVVTANQYGSATVVPVITFDAKGRITAVSSATITGGSGDAVLSATQTFSGANTFSSTVNISSVATITALVLGTTNYAAYGSSGTITPDATMGNNISITLTSSATINVPINAQDFQMFRYRIIQDGAGSRAVTLGSGFAFGTDVSSATFSTAASKVDYLSCIYRASSSKCDIVAPVIRGY